MIYHAVNAAVVLERPLLVKGEPASEGRCSHIKSTTKARQGRYEYDAVRRLRDSQLGDARVHDIRIYIKRGKLWDAFTYDSRPVLPIDETMHPLSLVHGLWRRLSWLARILPRS
jgi:hypothetical protein